MGTLRPPKPPPLLAKVAMRRRRIAGGTRRPRVPMMTLPHVIVSAPLMALRNAWWPNTVCRSQATSRVYLAANEPVKHRGRHESTLRRNLHLRTGQLDWTDLRPLARRGAEEEHSPQRSQRTRRRGGGIHAAKVVSSARLARPE